MKSPQRYTSISLFEIIVGAELPIPVFMFIEQKYVLIRNESDRFDIELFQKMELKGIKYLFIKEGDFQSFRVWSEEGSALSEPTDVPEAAKEFLVAKKETTRKVMDLLSNPDANEATKQAIEASKTLVTEMLKLPLGTLSLKTLHSYSPSLANHSVNVSILSGYLAIQMGYTHQGILKNLSLGSLLHDIGKTKIPADKINLGAAKEGEPNPIEDHPRLGSEFLSDASDTIPQEVQMIVEQHHENHEGSGYPHKLKGSHIYDLAKIVAIANFFDNAVTEAEGSLSERQAAALIKFEENENLFDSEKFRKAIKILKQSI